MKYHLNDLQKHKHKNCHLQRAFDLYGENAFVFSVLEVCDASNLDEREMCWIDRYNAFGENGYNMTLGGGGNRGYTISEETIAKIVSHRRSMAGSNNPMYGKKMIDVMGAGKYKAFIERNHDIRARTARENAKNRVLTDETHRKMSEAALRRIAIHGHPRTGYKMTEEERILHGERMKGLCAGAKNPNARKVALLNTGEIFDYIKEAAAKTGANQFSITECCTGKNKSAGDKDGMRLVWAYYEDYIKMSEDEIRQRIDNAQQPTFGAKNCNARPIICLNTNERFECISDACRKYHLDASSVVKCCKGKMSYSGKDPVTGEKLRWSYAA